MFRLIPRIPRRLRSPMLLLVFAACQETTSPVTYTLEVVDGDRQAGDLAAEADRSLVVRVLDQTGRPATGVEVLWRVLEGGAGLSEAITRTDESGLAHARVTYGIEPGPVLVLAQVTTQSVSFRLEARRLWQSAGVGFAHSCALSTRGLVYCWGANQVAQLGDDTETQRATPVPVFGRQQFASLAVGWFHTCALTLDGRVICWGANDHGQLGLGDRFPRHRPTHVPLAETIRSLSAGYLHTCAVGQGGRAYCWGSAAHGALGSGPETALCAGVRCALTPVRVESSVSFTSIAAGEFHSCAVSDDGAAYCWGWNSNGELGTGEIPGLIHDRPVRVYGVTRFEQIASQSRHSCAVTVAREALCWGRNATGEIGRPDHAWAPSPLPVGLPVRALATGALFTCALADARTICFGDLTGQTLKLTPETLPGDPFSQLSLGFAHGCGVAEHEVWCWGSNSRNQVAPSPGGGYIAAPTRVVFPQ